MVIMVSERMNNSYVWVPIIIIGSLFIPVFVSMVLLILCGVLYAAKKDKILLEYFAFMVIINQVSLWSSRMTGVAISDDIKIHYEHYRVMLGDVFGYISRIGGYEVIFYIYNAMIPKGLDYNGLLYVYLVTDGVLIYLLVRKVLSNDLDIDLMFLVVNIMIYMNTISVASQLARQMMALLVMCIAILYHSEFLGIIAVFVHLSTISSYMIFNLWRKHSFLFIVLSILFLAVFRSITIGEYMNYMYGGGDFIGAISSKFQGTADVSQGESSKAVIWMIYVFSGTIYFVMTRDLKLVILLVYMILTGYYMSDYDLLFKRIFLILDSALPFAVMVYMSIYRDGIKKSNLTVMRPMIRTIIVIVMITVSGGLLYKRVFVAPTDGHDKFRPMYKYGAMSVPLFGLMGYDK